MTGHAMQRPQHQCTETIEDDVPPAFHGLAYCVLCRVILLPTFLLVCGKICQWQRWSQVLGVHQYVLMLLGFSFLCLLQRHTSSVASKLRKHKQERFWQSSGVAAKPVQKEAIAGDEPVIIQPNQCEAAAAVATIPEQGMTDSAALQADMTLSQDTDSLMTDDGWSIVTPDDCLDASSSTLKGRVD